LIVKYIEKNIYAQIYIIADSGSVGHGSTNLDGHVGHGTHGSVPVTH